MSESKKTRPKIDEFAREKLDGTLYEEFEQFLDFLRKEKFSLPPDTINAYRMKYKGVPIGKISFLGKGSWEDGICDTRNRVSIIMDFSPDLFNVLDRESIENHKKIVDMVMSRLRSKCIDCREGRTECSKNLGKTVKIADESYKNICVQAFGFGFSNSGDSMEIMYENESHMSGIVPLENGAVSLDVIKDMIMSKKSHIMKPM